MEVNRFVDIGGRLHFFPAERYSFGWSDWRTVYPPAPSDAASPDRPTDLDVFDRVVFSFCDAVEWLVDQLLRVVP